MQLTTKPLCQLCEKEQSVGVYRQKWICGYCLIKFENKIKELNNKTLDLMELEIKDGIY